MAGNPLAKLFPYFKKYAVELYIGVGIYAYVSHKWNVDKTYKNVYSKFDFQRKYHLENMKKFIQISPSQV